MNPSRIPAALGPCRLIDVNATGGRRIRPSSTGAGRRRRSLVLRIEFLEDRAVPSVSFVFDYRFDTGHFFDDPNRRSVLQAAADHLGQILTNALPSATLNNVTINDPAGIDWEKQLGTIGLPQDTIVLYVAGSSPIDNYLGRGGPSSSGFWGGLPRIGEISFNIHQPWFFSISTDFLSSSGAYDFYSVALHEIGHVLGIGVDQAWTSHAKNGVFSGGFVDAWYGGPVPLNGNADHWADGLQDPITGDETVMQPSIPPGTRLHYTMLDYLALADLGWGLNGNGIVSDSPKLRAAWRHGGGPHYALLTDGNLVTAHQGLSVTLDTGVDWFYLDPKDGALVDHHSDGRLVLADGNGWSLLNDHVIEYWVTGDARWYYLRDDGALWEFTHSPFWNIQIDSDVQSFTVDANGTLNVVHRPPFLDQNLPIVTAPAIGGSQVNVFSGADGHESNSFFPYGGFVGGVSVAVGDIDGDGRNDIITGAGPGGGPHVRVFSGADGHEIRSFFAYSAAFTGGVNVASGDVDGDGRDDIITGAGAGGGPHVRVFSGADGHEIRGFFAYGATFTGGVDVAVGDINGDGRNDIITGAGPGGGPDVRVFSGVDGHQIRAFYAYSGGFTGGVRVAAKATRRFW